MYWHPARAKPTPNLSMPFPGGSSSRNHEDRDPRRRLARAWRGFLRKAHGYSGRSGAWSLDTQHLGEHAPPGPPTGRAAGRAAQHSSARCWSTPETMLVRARRGHVWGKGELSTKSGPFPASPTEGMLPA